MGKAALSNRVTLNFIGDVNCYMTNLYSEIM